MSEVWGTVYAMERDKATGNDPASLRREIARLKLQSDGFRAALEKIKVEASDTSRDGDAHRLEAQMSFLAGTAEDALTIYG